MSLDNPDRACAICGEAVDTNDSEHAATVEDENGDNRGWAHRACIERELAESSPSPAPVAETP